MESQTQTSDLTAGSVASVFYCIFSKAGCSSAKMRGCKIYLDGFHGNQCNNCLFAIAVYIVQHSAKITWDVDKKCTVWPDYSSFSHRYHLIDVQII